VALWLGATLLVAGAGRAGDLTFQKLNRTYTDFVPELEEVNEGGMVVRLDSPKQALVLRDHRIHLVPGADGVFDGWLELDIQGKGTIIADVEFGPLQERFNEDVIVPPQTVRLDGKVRLRRIEGGYAVDPVQIPRKVSVAVQSKTINTILALCDQAAILSLGSIECVSLEGALTRPTMTIPETESFTLPDAELTADDRAALDALIAPVP
jgi:hypothetical protein